MVGVRETVVVVQFIKQLETDRVNFLSCSVVLLDFEMVFRCQIGSTVSSIKLFLAVSCGLYEAQLWKKS